MLLVWGWEELAKLRSHDRWMQSSALTEGEDAAWSIATPSLLTPLLVGRQDRAFPIGSHEGLVLSRPLSSSSSCPLPISSFLHPDRGEPQPPCRRSASPAGRQQGGREGGKAKQPCGGCVPRLSTGLRLHVALGHRHS